MNKSKFYNIIKYMFFNSDFVLEILLILIQGYKFREGRVNFQP